ncbi:helicase-like transcription factor [Orycteropus afer afer]|uniref:Helicase-like transcription factor n=1 Tax=Orycteropus afer afer TaxID=1230840 RepID=A0A8B6ZRQ4_ORYAF|nr:helicase-like transcription factor [Orycteropus afer afer]
MSWMFKRDPVWKYLQTVQYGAHGNFSRLSYPTFFPRFEFQDVIPPDDFVTNDEDLDSVLFGTLRGHVVGLRYYTGVVNNNEMVALQREPNNPYDKNAIKVNNVNGNQVGHIKKDLAAALASIMDSKLAQVEGVVPFGANNAFTMPLHMAFWGKEENRKAVLDHLKKHGFKLLPPPKTLGFSLESGWGSGRAGPSYSMPVHAAVQMTTEQLKTEFDKLFEDLKEDDKTQEMEPAEAVETPLLPHQKQALAWMVSRENSKELPPFWEQRSDLYYNTITNFSEKDRPENVHGGILADDMGLECNVNSESVELEGNITSEKADGLIKEGSRCSTEPSISDVQEKNKYPMSEFSSPRPKRRKTVDKYIESSDSEEFETNELPQKTKGKLKNVKSEAKNRGKGSSKLKEDPEFMCALTSPTTTTKKKMLKKGASAVEDSKKTDLEEKPRTTLIICPLSVLSNWIDQFGQHIKSDVHLNFYVYYGPDRIRDPTLLSKQDIVLTTYNILTHDYGTKGDSPLHSIRWLRVILDEGHAIRNPNAQQTKAVLDLEAERRWVLTGSDTPEELRKKLVRKMKLILSSGSDEECAICLDSLTVPVITHCAHVFCKPCICQVIQNEQPNAKCPLCRNNIDGSNLLECPPEELASITEKKTSMEWTSSSKINALMHALIDLRTKNPNIKSLVVSQFTTFLSLIETPLKASGFVFTRLDGSMSQKKRVESIQCFQNTEAGSPTIMLLSLKAGGVGLNLSAASRVFLMDPAWNPAAEDQCFDRCHRLGQKQEVIITKFIVKDSVEENMLKIQNTKRELAAGAFGTKKTNANEMKQAKIDEIKTLIDL